MKHPTLYQLDSQLENEKALNQQDSHVRDYKKLIAEKSILTCPKCGGSKIYSWTGLVRSLIDDHFIRDKGASIECGECKFKIQGKPGERLNVVTPRWKRPR